MLVLLNVVACPVLFHVNNLKNITFILAFFQVIHDLSTHCCYKIISNESVILFHFFFVPNLNVFVIKILDIFKPHKIKARQNIVGYFIQRIGNLKVFSRKEIENNLYIKSNRSKIDKRRSRLRRKLYSKGNDRWNAVKHFTQRAILIYVLHTRRHT